MAVKYHSSSLSGDAYDAAMLFWYFRRLVRKFLPCLLNCLFFVLKKAGWFYSSWKVFQGARFRVFVNSSWSQRFARDLFIFTYSFRPWVSKDGINIIINTINIFPCSQQILNSLVPFMYRYVINKCGLQSADDTEFLQVNLYESLLIAFLWKRKISFDWFKKEREEIVRIFPKH